MIPCCWMNRVIYLGFNPELCEKIAYFSTVLIVACNFCYAPGRVNTKYFFSQNCVLVVLKHKIKLWMLCTLQITVHKATYKI